MIQEDLQAIQEKLQVAKSRHNDFLNANFRSAEDILKALKPLLKERGCTIVCTDDIVAVGQPFKYYSETSGRNGVSSKKQYEGPRFYVKATVTLTNKEDEKVSATGYAREAIEKGGVDVAQVTGAASSYARKYALNGLFAIDDGQDADTNAVMQGVAPNGAAGTTDAAALRDEFLSTQAYINGATTKQQLQDIHNQHPALKNYAPFSQALNEKWRTLQ